MYNIYSCCMGWKYFTGIAAPMPVLFFTWPCRTQMTSYQFLHTFIFPFIISSTVTREVVPLHPEGFCGVQAETRCSPLFIQIYSFFLSLSDVGCVNQWARGDPPALLPKLTVSSQSTFPKWKASPPQSQSSITLLPPSDCCLSSFISLLMVYKLRVMIPPLPSALGDFLWPFWFCEASFCKWAVISRAVCRAVERQEVKLHEMCLMQCSHWEEGLAGLNSVELLPWHDVIVFSFVRATFLQ